MKTIRISICLLFVTLSLSGLAQAGTIVWDFDTTNTLTAGLEAGAADGDFVAPEWWRFINDGTGSYLIASEFVFSDGWFTLTFSAYDEGRMPFQNHGSGIDVGNVISGGTELGLENINVNYPYMIWYGEIGWSTNNPVGSRFIFNVAERVWYGTQYEFTWETNVEKRHVVDLVNTPQASGDIWAQTLKGFWWDVFGIFRVTSATTSAPAFMAERWNTEFDSDPNVTFLRVDWFAFSDNPNFRSTEPANSVDAWTIFD